MKTNLVRKNPYRVILMTLATASVVIFCSQAAWSQGTQLSDSLTVDIGIGGVPTGNPQFAPVPENGPPQQVAIPLPDVLIQPGFVNIFEPDGTTISDVVFSVTGASIHLASDPDLPTLAQLQGLPDLSPAVPLIEGPNGINMPIGNLFAIPGGPPIQPFQIIVVSDGNVPEPGTLTLFAFGICGLLGHRWKRRMRGA